MESGQLIIQTLQIHVWHFPFCVAPIKLMLKGITSQDKLYFLQMHPTFQMFAINVAGELKEILWRNICRQKK